MISVLAQAELDGNRLDDDEICAFLRLLLPAGAETTYRSSSNLLVGLLTNPDQLDALRADRSLMTQAIEEGLRWEPPLLGIMRTATRDTEVDGVSVPAGSTIVGQHRLREPRRAATGTTPRSSTSSGRRASTSRSRGARTCASACTSRGWRRRSLLTQLFDRLPNLRLDPDAEAPQITGMVFRAPHTLPVVWD